MGDREPASLERSHETIHQSFDDTISNSLFHYHGIFDIFYTIIIMSPNESFFHSFILFILVETVIDLCDLHKNDKFS